ncbi:ribonuclease T2-like isoform X1 [Girardinichthys multiradiatus]|uniref:ribonuclease T2-like isoform X1 n=1 Tax=Girardinichthys multiradiatus TaxID=208333 RepID=UPI001FAE4DD5|nr:ribonuclease T2-like isoform X1 [Girardinichthys multiradiatus]XP_047248540.1 ribonuclease T2-like isoform X1 [Girardinichthys multiradiatus]XP_047248541.1 ribonuclease T2-like isoform X1 [Girardinichthys multiradiatus]XP_047248542.1 ribonuclease T2-like isoform X1 [Girardinichthys multiradiatus]
MITTSAEDQKKTEMSCTVLPLLVTLSPALFFLLLRDVSVTQGLWEDYKYGRHSSELLHQEHNCSWTCMLFTLQWPGGFCQVRTLCMSVKFFNTKLPHPCLYGPCSLLWTHDGTGRNLQTITTTMMLSKKSLYKETQCKIPQNISSWTIHGLWPLHAQWCCSCWPFFHSDVQELKEELTEYWPSLLKTKSSFHFWKEEWIKHGSCAACVEGFNSPLRYFQICLKLRHQFDIYKLLEDAGITPSCERLYKVAEVQKVLLPHIGEKHEVQCVQDQKDRQVLFQVKVRLSRNLTIGCDHHGDTNVDLAVGLGPGQGPSTGHPCPPDVPFYYFPINHQEPWRPCG